MGKFVKSYHVFLSSGLMKGLIYFLHPLGMMFIQLMLIGISLELEGGLGMAYSHSAGLIFMAELFWEYFLFGGMNARNTNKLEYLKTSEKGLHVLKAGVIAGTIRRGITVALILWLPWWISGEQASVIILIAYVWILLMAELGNWVVRQITSFLAWVCVASIGTIVLESAMNIAKSFQQYRGLLFLYFAVGILLMVYNVFLVMKKARESYYDIRTEKELEAD